MNSDVLFGKVKTYIDSLRGKRANGTLINSALILRDFILWAKEQPPQDIRELVEGYMSYLRNTKKLAHVTINHHFFTIKPYVDWVTKDKSILEDVELYTVVDKYIDYRPLEELVKLLDVAETPEDKAIVATLIFTGARINEVLSLQWRHVEFSPNMDYMIIHFKTEKRKGNPERGIPVKEPIAVKAMYDYFGTQVNVDETFLTSARMFPKTYKKFWHDLKDWCKKAKIKELHPHTFRHSLATAMLKREENIKTVKEMLGHSSIQTTEKYLHISGLDLLNSAPVVMKNDGNGTNAGSNGGTVKVDRPARVPTEGKKDS